MKILIGTESFPPSISGVAVSSQYLAENLAKTGYQVMVFAPSPTGKTYLESDHKFSIWRLRSIRNPFRRDFRVAFRAKRDILSGLGRFQPDIIHLQDPTSIGNILRKEALRRKIPLVVSNHFSLEYLLSYVQSIKPLHPLLRRMVMAYLRHFYNSCQVVICPTETVKRELQRWGIKKEIVAISNSLDLERFYSYSSERAIKLKYHLPANPIVLYVGRLDKDKNLEVLIRAIPETRPVNPHYVIVGSGNELAKIKRLVDSLGVGSLLSLLGWVDHQSPDLPRLYQIASVFAIPSPYETQSLVTLEAMAAGVPIVAPSSGALPEIVQDGQNGFLFEAGNHQQMAQKIVAILKDKRLHKKMARKSLEIISQHQLKESFEKIRKVYEKLYQAS